MGDDRATQGSAAAKVAVAIGVVVVVIAVNVLIRVVSLPDLDLPSISLPEIPRWVRAVLKLKNLALLVLAVVVVGGFVLKQIEEHRARRSAS